MTDHDEGSSDGGSLERSLTAKIVAGYVSHHTLPVAELAGLIAAVHNALKNVGAPVVEPVVKQEPAVPVRKSITPDYLICLEDGKKLRMLKRHLQSRYGLSPDQYRAKWNLSADYPMVAPSYAQQRSDLAKSIGLGRKPAPPPAPEPVPVKRGRRPKSAAAAE